MEISIDKNSFIEIRSDVLRRNINFFVVSFKKMIIPIIFILFTVFLVVFSQSNLVAAKNGLKLWANSVVPSLFPFFIATELLGYTNIVPLLGKLLNKIMKPIFNVSGEGAFPLIMGIISGYPTGAKIVANFRKNGICTKAEAERLLAFTNNSGPLFIIGTVGISMFGYSKIGLLLLVTHILASLTVGFIFRFWKFNDNEYIDIRGNASTTSSNKEIKFSDLGKIIGNSISNATSTILMIGGFVVLFSVIISILKNTYFIIAVSNVINPICNFFGLMTNYSTSIVSGLLELTNGLNLVTSINDGNISNNIIVSAFLLGFGSLSVLLQVFSVISDTDISILPYFLGKCLQAVFAALYTFVFLHNSMMFNLDFSPSFLSLGENLVLLFIVLSLILLLIYAFKNFSSKTNYKKSYIK